MKMKSVALALATLFAAGSPLFAQNHSAQHSGTVAPPPPSAPHTGIFKGEGGETVFKKLCAACHLANGAGYHGLYPALAKNTRLAEPDYPIMVIIKGQNAMPAIGGMLTDQQIADVVNYVRGNLGNTYRATTKSTDVAALRH